MFDAETPHCKALAVRKKSSMELLLLELQGMDPLEVDLLPLELLPLQFQKCGSFATATTHNRGSFTAGTTTSILIHMVQHPAEEIDTNTVYDPKDAGRLDRLLAIQIILGDVWGYKERVATVWSC